MESRTARWLIRFGSVVALLFLYIPLVIVVLYAFNDSIGQKWPISHFTTKYFSLAWHNPDLREALINSLLIASVATVLALLLGSAAAFAVHRYRFFGRNSRVADAGPADHAAGHRHGDRAQLVVQHVRDLAGPAHDHDRPRDVLHRRRLQQRDRAAAAHADLARGGVAGPGRRRMADVPAT